MRKIFFFFVLLCLCACSKQTADTSDAQPKTLRDSVAQLVEDVRQLRVKMDEAIAIQEQQAMAVDSQKQHVQHKLERRTAHTNVDVLGSAAFDGHWMLGAISSRKVHIRLHHEGYGQLKGEYYYDDAADQRYDLDGYVNSDGSIQLDVLLASEPQGSMQLKEQDGALRGSTSTGAPVTAR